MDMFRIMVKSATIALAVGLMSAFVGCAKEQGLPKLIPRQVVFGNPEKARATISPDGKMLAYLAPVGENLNVWVRTIGKDDDRPVTNDTERSIIRYVWGPGSDRILYLQDAAGNENWRLYSVHLETGEVQEFTPFENVQVQIVEWDKHFPNELLIAMNKDDARLHDVYHLDLTTGDLEMVAKNPGNVVDWMADRQLKIRGAVTPTPEGGLDFLVRDNETSDWRPLIEWGAEDALSSAPMGFSLDGNYVYLTDSRDANAGRLVKADASTGKVVEVLVSDPNYDVDHVMFDGDTYEPQAAVIVKERDEWVILDETLVPDFEAIRTLDEGDPFITSRDNDAKIWIVGFTKDDGPVSYYAYDTDTKTGKFLFYHRSDLLKYTLAEMQPISYSARDGMTIHGYITYPPGLTREGLPVVLNVHGGPWYRDVWGYNPEAQWLANRGYACLQVNFRGSTGYGKAYLNAGNKEWGGKMEDDLIDGVNWAVAEGVADPARIAIYGASYGGYAALVGATFTPDVFCCAVAAMGPSNLITFIETIPPYWTPMLSLMYERVGNPETEADFLKSRSPLFKVDQIKIPMLIAQGANDVRVKASESEQIVEAMKEKGIQYEYLVFPDEGHGFLNEDNRLKFYAAAEKFIASHMNGRYEE
jgi:dipeptidyl aminopeptidase/acylaminoacyl peptidase